MRVGVGPFIPMYLRNSAKQDMSIVIIHDIAKHTQTYTEKQVASRTYASELNRCRTEYAQGERIQCKPERIRCNLSVSGAT